LPTKGSAKGVKKEKCGEGKEWRVAGNLPMSLGKKDLKGGCVVKRVRNKRFAVSPGLQRLKGKESTKTSKMDQSEIRLEDEEGPTTSRPWKRN